MLVVPLAEPVLGALTTLGLFARWVLVLGGLLIAALVFGTAMRSDWHTVGVQIKVFDLAIFRGRSQGR